MFTGIVQERVGWYVYALRDPRDGRLFYIGKGRGDRVFQHAQAAQAADSLAPMGQKLELIRSIQADGLEVEAIMLRHGLSSERAAYEVEAAVIDVLRLMDPGSNNQFFSLTNLVLGHHHEALGLASVDVVNSLYDAPEAPPITEPAILIRIPGQWTPHMSADELYRATRYWWRIGKRREQAKYAFSVNRGVIRQVYSIDSWRAWTAEDGSGYAPERAIRHGFTGSIAEDMQHYVNTSVKHLFKVGEASPIKYVNC